MKKMLFILSLALMLPLSMRAQEVSEECVVNISLFNESVKNKQYAEAWDPWWQVYTTCPSANKAIYTRGDELVEWKIEQTQDPAEYNRLRSLLLQLHNDRIKYFGSDPKYPTAYILGLKGVDYCTFFKEDQMKDSAYLWLRQSIDGMGVKSQVSVLAKYAELSNTRYKINPEMYGEAYINDYQLVSGLLGDIANSGSKSAAKAAQQKD